MKKIITVISLVFLTLVLSGCDSEIHDRMLIRGVGIDYSEGKYEVSVRAENVTDSSEELLTSKGETVYDALTSLSLQSGSRQMYADSYYIIFGDSCLNGGIEKAVDFFIRYFKAMPTEQLYIAKGSANEILSLKNNDKLISSDVIRDMKNSVKNSGKTVSLNLMELLSLTMSPSGTAVIPVISVDGETLSLDEAVILKDYRPALRLKSDEISAYLISKGEVTTASLVCEDVNYGKVTLEINKSESKLNIDELPDNFTLDVNVTCFIASVTVGTPMEIEDIADIESKASEKLKTEIESVINKSYKSGADILGINYKLYREQNELFSELSNTEQHEKNFNITVNVKTKIVKTGEEDRPGD